MFLKLICLLLVFFTVGMTVGGILCGWDIDLQNNECNSVFYNYRNYNPIEGRWTSRDPIEEKGELCLYSFLKNEINTIDYLGQDRYLSSWIFSKKSPSMHIKIAVEVWECQRGKWHPSGVCYIYDFTPEIGWWSPTLFISGATKGQVEKTTSSLMNLVCLGDYYSISSTREQDEKLIRYLDSQIECPPVYNFLLNNCIHWSLNAFFIGMEEGND